MARLVAFNGWPGDEHNGDVHQGCSQHDSILGIEHHEGRHPGQADNSEDTRNWVTRHMETGICDPTLIHSSAQHQLAPEDRRPCPDNTDRSRVNGYLEGTLGNDVFESDPSRKTLAVMRMPPAGVLNRLRVPANFGASPAAASDLRTRPVAYNPEFTEENAAVMTTIFMASPIHPTPMAENAVTKGDSSAEYSLYGSNMASKAKDPR